MSKTPVAVRILALAFGVLVAALGGYVIVVAVHRTGMPTLLVAVTGGALILLGGGIAFPRRTKAAGQQLVAALTSFFGTRS